MAGNEIATVEKEIEAIYNEIKKLASDGSALEIFRNFDKMYQRTRLRERTTLVFCGKSSTGKSTIMRALTGDDSIAVGVGETTNRNQEFLWGDGLLLVDTPGIFTDTAENAREAKRAMDEADMIAYCVSSSLFDHIMDETGYFKQLLMDYRDKLILCITKCSNTSPELYFNIEDDVINAIGDDAYGGNGEKKELVVLFFDAKDYIEGRKNNDKGLIRTSNFEYFLMCIGRISESEAYVARCVSRLRQMQGCLNSILESIPRPSHEERERSKEETATLNRIEDVRRRAFAEIKHLSRCKIEISREVRMALHENGVAELLPQLEQSSQDKLEQAVCDVQNRIYSTLAELEIAVHIDNPNITELKIDGSGITKGTTKNTPGKHADKVTELGGVAKKGVDAVAEMARKETAKRSWWQFWKKAPDIGGEGTVLYQHLSKSGIGKKLSPQIGRSAEILAKHPVAIQGAFAALGIAVDLVQAIHSELNERKQQIAIKRILQNFDVSIQEEVERITKELQGDVDDNCREAQDTIRSRLAVYGTSEDQVRWVVRDLQYRIGRLQTEIQNGGKA